MANRYYRALPKRKCPECGSFHTTGMGTYRNRKGKMRRRICQECARSFSEPVQK